LSVSPVGMHCILELHGCPPDLLNDVMFVRDAIEQASTQSLSTLLKLTSHQFYPQGVTAVGLLAESHLSIHTWPEYGYAAVDIFTCGEEAEPQRACQYLTESFAARKHSLVVLPRGVGTPNGRPASDMEFPEEAELCRAPQ